MLLLAVNPGLTPPSNLSAATEETDQVVRVETFSPLVSKQFDSSEPEELKVDDKKSRSREAEISTLDPSTDPLTKMTRITCSFCSLEWHESQRIKALTCGLAETLISRISTGTEKKYTSNEKLTT